MTGGKRGEKMPEPMRTEHISRYEYMIDRNRWEQNRREQTRTHKNTQEHTRTEQIIIGERG